MQEHKAFANTKGNPLAALERIVEARALAGRMRTGAPLLQHERELMEALRRAERRQRLQAVGAGAARTLATLGVGAGAALGVHRVVQQATRRRPAAAMQRSPAPLGRPAISFR